MKLITLLITIAAALLSMATAAVVERQISVVPSGSVTTVTSIYTSINTMVIAPTEAVWTDPSTTQTTWLPIQTPKPTVITSITTQTFYPSTSTTSSSSTSSSTSTSTSSAPPTTIIINATTASFSSIAATSSTVVIAAGGRHGLGAGAYAGIGVASAVVLLAIMCCSCCAYKCFRSWLSPYDEEERERREKHRRSVLRRQNILRQYVAPDTKTERLRSMIYGQVPPGREISSAMLTHVGDQPIAPGAPWPPPLTQPQPSQPPQRPARPNEAVDEFIAAAQHGGVDSHLYDEENGIEMQDTNPSENEYSVPDPYLQPPRRVVSSIYSQQTSQPVWTRRGTINTNTIDNAINDTLQEYSSASTVTPPPDYSVMDERMYEQASQLGTGAGNTYSQYGEDNYRHIDENEDDLEKRDRERDRAMRLLLGEEVEPSNRDTGLSGMFGMRKTNI